MKKSVIVIIIGIVLLVVGGVLSVMSLMAFTSPADDAIMERDFRQMQGNATVRLEPGKYEIWCIAEMDEPLVEVMNSDGSFYYSTFATSGSETVSPGDTEFQKLGTFSIERSDDYLITATKGHIYITPPTNYLGTIMSMCGGIVMTIIGVITLIAGIIYFLIEKKKDKSTGLLAPTIAEPPAPSPYEPPHPSSPLPPPSPYEPPPPPSPPSPPPPY